MQVDPRPTHSRDADEGFNFAEVIVVIMVLAILATVAIFVVRRVVAGADDAATKTDAKVLERAEEDYRTLHGRYTTEQELVDGGFLVEPSAIHDIVVESSGADYRLVKVDNPPPVTTVAPTTSVAATTTSSSTTTSTTSTTSTTTTTIAPSTTAAPTTAAPTTAAPTTAAPTTATPTTVAAGPGSGGTTTTVAPSGRVTCSFVVTSASRSGGTGQLTITNGTSTALTRWTVRITQGRREIDLRSASQSDGDDGVLVASNISSNGNVPARSSATPTTGSISGSGLTVGQSFACSYVSR